MMTSCELVAERVALGEPLGDLTEHAASCVPCAALAATAARLGGARHAVDPGMGFTARMTVAAQHRLAVRRRNRVAGGVAASIAAGVLGIVAMTRTPDGPAAEPRPVVKLPLPAPTPDDPTPSPDPSSDDDLRALLRFADVDHTTKISARWGRIQKPVKPYRALVKGTR